MDHVRRPTPHYRKARVVNKIHTNGTKATWRSPIGDGEPPWLATTVVR